MANMHLGSTFDSFLEEEGLLEETQATAIKRIVAYQIEQAMEKMEKEEHLSSAQMIGYIPIKNDRF